MKKKKKYIILCGVIVLAASGVFWALSSGGDNGIQSVSVERGMVISEVSVTGQVVPARSINLAFEKSGRVSAVFVSVGSKVSSGAALVRLESGELYAQIEQAEANLKVQEAKLEELKRGPREGEIRVKQTELQKSEQDLDNYYASIPDLLNDAYAKADDAVRAKTDELFLNDDTKTPQLTFTVANSQAQVNIISLRVKAGEELMKWRGELQEVSSSAPKEDLKKTLSVAKSRLAVVRDFLTTALDALDSTANVSASTVASYKSNIYTGRTNVNTSFSSLTSQEQLIASQTVAVERIKNELSLLLEGNSEESIKAQEAQVAYAKGNLSYYRSQLEKNFLRAPFSGTITKIDVKKGNIVTANSAVCTLIGGGGFEIEVNVAESDIAKVRIENKAKVTLDAYGRGEVFEAAVSQIDLSETIIEGVATYKTKLQFESEDPRILPGLTADVDILSEVRENALYVPTRNIFIDGSRKYVRKVGSDGEIKEVDVETGLRGSNGKTEIISGLNEGDIIAADLL